MVTYPVNVTPSEAILLDDIEALEYGEIFDVELDGDGRPTILRYLTSAQKSLVDLIRTGVVSFPTLKVHQKMPAYAEVVAKTQSDRYRCKRLHKFV
jgi:hypothetical protein